MGWNSALEISDVVQLRRYVLDEEEYGHPMSTVRAWNTAAEIPMIV